MTTRRTARVNRAIQEAVSTAVLFKVKDPRVKNVTVLRAEATDDLRQAKVYVSVMGDEKRQALTMNGLAAARGFLQSKVADRLQTKQTPILTFVLDQSVKQNAAAQAALSHLFPVPEAGEDDSDEEESGADDLDGLDSGSPEDLELDDGSEADDDLDDFEDEDFEDEDFETEDLSADDGAGAIEAAIDKDVHETVIHSPVVAGQATAGEGLRNDLNKMDVSEPAEPEENEDLPSR
ncbi:MAG: ribosome-binding factor [Planctomycetaceae bacterium]|nr:ribosome-binding factor [Planctomycetaceae bacterium]